MRLYFRMFLASLRDEKPGPWMETWQLVAELVLLAVSIAFGLLGFASLLVVSIPWPYMALGMFISGFAAIHIQTKARIADLYHVCDESCR